MREIRASKRFNFYGHHQDNTDDAHDDQHLARENPELHHLVDKSVYQNRRRMAYIALFCIIALALFVFFYLPPEQVSVYESIISWFLGTFAAIVLGYMGSTVIPQFAISNRNNRPGTFG